MQDIDRLLDQIKQLSARIDLLDPDDPERLPLEAERELLRADARQAVGPGASVDYLRYELAHLERRLAELRGEEIEPPSAARNPMAFTDHAAFARRINEMLESKTGDERVFLEKRIAELRRQLDSPPSDRSTS